jgi:hypothetical protein
VTADEADMLLGEDNAGELEADGVGAGGLTCRLDL